jgi:two-component system, NarL family, invasion response regulator UvrY
MIEVLIVDDHHIVREGLERIISFENDIKVVGKSVNAAEAIRFLAGQKVDVVILDISMPGRSGMDIIQDLKKIRSEVKIIMLSMHQEEQFAMRAFKSGASGYLTKEMAPEEIVKAIRKVNSGRKYISSRYAEILADEIQGDADKMPHERLSNREFEVMCMIGRGVTISNIAAELCLSDRTISTYHSRIFEKMNIKSNAEITIYLIEHGMLVK